MGKKRNRQRAEEDENVGLGSTVAMLQTPPANGDAQSPSESHEPLGEDGWQEAPSQDKKKRRKNPAKGTANYPSILHSHNARLQTSVKISDIQGLILYILSDGPAPQWVAVRHSGAIRKVVALTVPGLDPGLFTGKTPLLDSLVDVVPSEESKLLEEHVDREKKLGMEQSTTDLTMVEAAQAVKTKLRLSPDDYYPSKLDSSALAPVLKPLADIFPHIWPIKSPGDDKYSKIHSPLQAMLLAPLPKNKEEKKKKGPTVAKSAPGTEKPTPITEFIASAEELEDNDYVLHPSLFDTQLARLSLLEKRQAACQSSEHGWVDTLIENAKEKTSVDEQEHDLTAGRNIVAIDCEMCKTAPDKFELTRISVLGWDGKVILDELVKPDNPIIDYLTPYSGITEEMLAPVETRLADIQARLLEIITPSTIVIGHSLDGDFKALKMTHPFIVDTAIIYPHPRGPPLKSSLKWLTQKYLGREIQKSHGSTGHDSVEDAKAVLDLAKQKCEKGPKWGTSEASSESIFTRLKRSLIPKLFRANPEMEEFRTSAAIDWGTPSRGLGANADVIIGCENDADVVEGVKRVLKPENDSARPQGVDFIWARFREIEAVRGWWASSKTIDNDELRQQALSKYGLSEDDVKNQEADPIALSNAVSQTINFINEIYNALPPCTAFIVYSGHGDPRETFRLQSLNRQFHQEYRVKKWDELSVKWTDTEAQQLRKACKKAREGVGFIAVK